MVGKFKSIALAGALTLVVSPAFAQMMDLPVIGNIDLDPFHIMTPAPAAAPAAPMMMKKHHMMHHKMMHKKMMKKKMMMKKKKMM